MPDEMQRVIRIVFLDFRHVFDLIEHNKLLVFCLVFRHVFDLIEHNKHVFDLIKHNKLLENIKEMVVRSVLIRWFASYLNEQSHFSQFGKEASDFVNVTGGVPQSSKLGPTAFVIKINMLPSVIEQVVAQGVNDDVVDENTIFFLHDTTSWKALDVYNHGNISKKIDLVKDFAESEKMELNTEKW